MVTPGYIQAREDFRKARRQAALEQLLSRLRGKPSELLSYDEVRRLVGAQSRIERGLEEIPVDAIVGSVGRYADFTRTFLPRTDQMQERWARVKAVATGPSGWPPIEVYKLGQAYFVIDGNHRVSVARQMGLKTIPAYVTEVQTRVPLSADVDPQALVLKARYAAFLEQTGLGRNRLDADLSLTEADAYHDLEEHIAVHRYYMGLEQQREIPYEEAAAHWYDTVFRPVADVIRARGLLHDFPDRTEADLYLWLMEHRSELEEALGWTVSADAAALDLADRRSGSRRMLARVGGKLRGAFTPDEFEPGPPPGEWRTKRLASRRENRLFYDLLVAINGQDQGWRTLEQAIVIARREGSELRGLHIVAEEQQSDSPDVHGIRDRFQWRLGEVGIDGRFVVESGPVAHTLCDRARWNDLLVMPLTHPPGGRVLQRLSSGFRSVVQRCPRPILAVPQEPTPMQRALLAYDGSAKAQEALFIVTYLAARWGFSPVVLTIETDDIDADQVLDRARRYLQRRGVEAVYEVKSGDVAAKVHDAAEDHDCDFIIIGGYGSRPVVEIVLGSVLNQVLRTAQIPILIAR